MLDRSIEIVDVGASDLDGPAPYRKLLETGLARVTGFDPQAELLPPATAHSRYRPYALGDGDTHTLNVCYAPGMTSFLRPDPAQLEKFPRFMAFGRVIGRHLLDTVRLDDLDDIVVDVLKLDIQGYEKIVLEHGQNKLSQCVALQLEVSWVPLYEQQPLFSTVDTLLRGMGFAPLCAVSHKHLPMRLGAGTVNQLIESDMLYVRAEPTPEQWQRLAVILQYWEAP
jgi:hypothetical protein